MRSELLDSQLLHEIVCGIYSLGDSILKQCRFFNRTATISFSSLADYFGEAGKNVHLSQSESLPADVRAVTLKRNLAVGCTGRTRTHFFIVVKSEMPVEFERLFVTAHELGHVFLHFELMDPSTPLCARANVDLLSPRSSFYARYTEIEANIFALVLLIPDQLIMSAKKGGNIDETEVQQIYYSETGLFLPRGAAADRVNAFKVRYEAGQPTADWSFVCRGTPGASQELSGWEAELVSEEQAFRRLRAEGP